MDTAFANDFAFLSFSRIFLSWAVSPGRMCIQVSMADFAASSAIVLEKVILSVSSSNVLLGERPLGNLIVHVGNLKIVFHVTDQFTVRVF